MNELILPALIGALLLFRKKTPPAEPAPDEWLDDDDLDAGGPIFEEQVVPEQVVPEQGPEMPDYQPEGPAFAVQRIQPPAGLSAEAVGLAQRGSDRLALRMAVLDQQIALAATARQVLYGGATRGTIYGDALGNIPRETQDAIRAYYRNRFSGGEEISDRLIYQGVVEIAFFAKNLRRFADAFPVLQPVRPGTLLSLADLRPLQLDPREAHDLAEALNGMMHSLHEEAGLMRADVEVSEVFGGPWLRVRDNPALYGSAGAVWVRQATAIQNALGIGSSPESVGHLVGNRPGMRPYVYVGNASDPRTWCAVPTGWEFTMRSTPAGGKQLTAKGADISVNVGKLPVTFALSGLSVPRHTTPYNDCTRRAQIVAHYLLTRIGEPEIATLFSGARETGSQYTVNKGRMSPTLGLRRLLGVDIGRPSEAGRRRLRGMLFALTSGIRDLDIVKVRGGEQRG